jgi:hypothetical protein
VNGGLKDKLNCYQKQKRKIQNYAFYTFQILILLHTLLLQEAPMKIAAKIQSVER